MSGNNNTSINNDNLKFLEAITKIKENAIGFKNEISEVVDDFISVSVKYITDLQQHFDEINTQHNYDVEQLQKEIEEQKTKNDFEESNYNRVSFIKQQDKEINQSKLKIEELESKLRYAELEITRLKSSSYQSNESNESNQSNESNKNTTIDLGTSHLTTTTDYNQNTQDNLECETPSSENESSNDSVSEFVQCLARIGRKRFKFEDLSQEDKEEYPDNVFISKSGFVLGKSCSVMIDKDRTFCDDHLDKFENITIKPHREKRKTKSKSKTSSEDESVEEPPVEEKVLVELALPTEEEPPVEELKEEEPPVKEITEPPTFDDIEMYESDSGICYYEDMREEYKGYLYEITEDEEIGAFIKVK